MAKRQYFLIVDTETTQDNLVADFGAVICDRNGKIYNQCAVMVDGIFTDKENHPLFHDFGDTNTIWSKKALPKRYEKYNNMVKNGRRMIASVTAINRWLSQAQGKYNPMLTAYNLPFDTNKCDNTGIDLTVFSERFCLWSAAYTKWAKSKNYLRFVLNNHAFNPPTEKGNMTFQTNAEIMTRFVLNNPELADEPHTALEDIIYYELEIFKALMKNTSKAQLLEVTPYNWRETQVKDHFKV